MNPIYYNFAVQDYWCETHTNFIEIQMQESTVDATATPATQIKKIC